MSNSDHWNILASEIGAELPADPAPPPTANVPAPPKRERPERKAVPPAKKQADWSQVASVLGIESTAPASPASASPASAAPPAPARQPERQPRLPDREPTSREPTSRERAAEPVRRPAPAEPSRRPEPTPLPPAASTSDMSEVEFVEVEMVEEFQQDGPPQAADDGGESKEERPRRRRRRRRGGRRSASGRSNEHAEPGAAEPADAMDTRDLGHLDDELADDEGTDLDDEGDSAAAASKAAATEEGGEDHKERPRRRRRRRGGRGSSASGDRPRGDKPRGERPRAADIQSRLDQESQSQQKPPAGDDFADEPSDEFDEHDAPQGGDAQFASARTGGERDTRADVDLDEEDHLDDQLGDPLGEGQEHDDAADEALDKNSHRAIPSWEQAIGLIVAVNMDARARNPKSGHTRGRGRGRRPERGGDRGGGHHRS